MVIEFPAVSIVTVVYNSVADIEATICSVLNLSYPNIQYIVIDGSSTDGTLAVIEKYKSQIDIVISEPDKGIYDAMNKSIQYCTGEWVNFMNSGDIFNSVSTINDALEQAGIDIDDAVIYGKHKVAYTDKQLSKTPNQITELWKGMTIQHQSVFVKKAILEKFPFNIKYRFAADYDLFYNCYMRGYNIKFVDIFVSIVASNGFSESNSVSTYSEFREIALHYEGESQNISNYYSKTLSKRRVIGLLKKTFPFIDKVRLFFK